MTRAIFEEIFDGPNSIFGRIFGPSEETIAEAKNLMRQKPRRTVRFKLSNAHVDALRNGQEVTFKVGDEKFVIAKESSQ